MKDNEKCWCKSDVEYALCHKDFDLKLETLKKQGKVIPPKKLIKTKAQIEGIREAGRINSLILDKVAETGKVDYSKDFFGKHVGLTVTGQLEGETFAMAYGKIYTFGPTFRAENSNTKTHASEFWMIEPEIAFCDLEGLMDVEEDMLKYIVQDVLTKCHS